jgi:flagellar hook protein FlgE
MIRAMYSGISGMRAFQTKLDVISNNVANVNTSGYKLSRATFRDIMSQTISSGTVPQESQGGINARQIGLGVGVASIDTIFTQGSAQSTGVKTDLMIEGDGFFVVSETASGSALGDGTDSQGLLFTRAGNFYFDKNRNLVTADGLFVMDTQGQKIQIDPLAVAYNIDERGFIVQVDNKGEQIEATQRIGIAKFANPQGLEKVGSTRFRYTRVADVDNQPRNYIFESDNFEKGTGKIRSGFLEMSNVDLGVEFSEMILSQRGFQANTRIITTSDELLQEVVNLKR